MQSAPTWHRLVVEITGPLPSQALSRLAKKTTHGRLHVAALTRIPVGGSVVECDPASAAFLSGSSVQSPEPGLAESPLVFDLEAEGTRRSGEEDGGAGGWAGAVESASGAGDRAAVEKVIDAERGGPAGGVFAADL